MTQANQFGDQQFGQSCRHHSLVGSFRVYDSGKSNATYLLEFVPCKWIYNSSARTEGVHYGTHALTMKSCWVRGALFVSFHVLSSFVLVSSSSDVFCPWVYPYWRLSFIFDFLTKLIFLHFIGKQAA